MKRVPNAPASVEVQKPKSYALSFGLPAGGLVAMALAVVAVHDEYKKRLISILPTAMWAWATSGCHIGRSEALLSVPALLLVYAGVATFWLVRERVELGTVYRGIATGFARGATTGAALVTVFWLLALLVGLPGAC